VRREKTGARDTEFREGRWMGKEKHKYNVE
jgi:hypothetical protein